MVNFAEYYGKRLLSRPINIPAILKKDNKGMNSWLNYLIDENIIAADLRLPRLRIPGGKLVNSLEETAEETRSINREVVLKAQALTGGRGKAGGIKKISYTGGNFDIEGYLPEVRKNAETMFGMDLKGFKIF